MTTAQITGGAVEFSRPQNYSTDKSGAKVTLTFSCAEGTSDDDASAMLDRVARMAVDKARELAGDKPMSREVAALQAFQDRASFNGVQLVKEPPSSEKPYHGLVPPPKAEPAAVPPTQPAVVIGTAPAILPSSTTSETAISATAAPVSDGITDQQLREAVEHKVTKLVNDAGNDPVARSSGPVAVGKLIGSFVTPPQKVYAIPQAQRSAFLAGLAAL